MFGHAVIYQHLFREPYVLVIKVASCMNGHDYTLLLVLAGRSGRSTYTIFGFGKSGLVLGTLIAIKE